MFPTEADMNKFFDDERLTRYHYLTYAEYVEIFGKAVDTNYLPRINKKIIYGHFDYFNYCYNQTWEYKWYPILAVFSLNLLRLRAPTMVGTLAYLYTFDHFFENYFLHRNTNKRMIDISNSFSFHLNKQKYISLRQKYIEKYVKIVNRNIAAGVYDNFNDQTIQNAIKIGKSKSAVIDPELAE